MSRSSQKKASLAAACSIPCWVASVAWPACVSVPFMNDNAFTFGRRTHDQGAQAAGGTAAAVHLGVQASEQQRSAPVPASRQAMYINKAECSRSPKDPIGRPGFRLTHDRGHGIVLLRTWIPGSLPG